MQRIKDNQASDRQQQGHYKRSQFRISVCIRSQMKSEPQDHETRKEIVHHRASQTLWDIK